MSFVSYAQNFEDVMLWRALKHVKNGVYIDVGAQHPVVDSVSKAFYKQGWRGIHIEPVPAYAELLRKDRRDETVLQVAIADAEGMLELNVIPDTGLSTAVDEFAQRHQIERGYEPQRIQVPVLTLKSALKSLEGKEVHWLKIDVEGFEEKVLKGWDIQTLRPWVMVIEATIPNTSEADYESWEPILIGADYQFVYFDGLNRFYVSKEHAELIEAFSCPPNVFDSIELTENSLLCQGLIASHQANEKVLVAQTEKLTTDLNAINEYNAQLQAHSQWVQYEWDIAKQRIEELSKNTGQLETVLAAERARLAFEQARIENLTAELKVANEHNAQLQAHAQWLKNELDTANAKTHHWWFLADQFNQELLSVYNSKSWRITWPLRKLMLFSKWFFSFPIRLMLWIFYLPKRVARRLVVKTMAFVLKRPGLKNGAINWLDKHPNLKTKLRTLAQAQGLIAGPLISSQYFSETYQRDKTSTTLLPSLSSQNKAVLLSVEQILSRIRADMASLDKDKQA